MIFDTSVLFAAFDRSDRNHGRTNELLATVDSVLVPAPILVEIDWLSMSRDVPGTATVLRGIGDGSIRPIELTREDYLRVGRLCGQYDDLPLGLVDASVVAVAERLGQDTIATLDRRHFSVVRPNHVSAFMLVP